MKSRILIILSLIIALGIPGPRKKEPAVENTFEQTPENLIDESKEVTTKTYYELSNGTWKTDEHTYKYRLEVTGRLNHAAKDTTFIILSNIEHISFEQAWKASGLSSNSNDYFDVRDAVFVAVR